MYSTSRPLNGYGIIDAYTKSETYTKTEANTTFIENSEKAVASGVATLDADTKVLAAQLPTATEVVTGVAKIATTAIAQEGINDTDFLTPKKLRNALNASGDAPVSACRAWLSVNTVTSTILQSFNIASFVKTTTGQFEITFTTPMPHQNYVAF